MKNLDRNCRYIRRPLLWLVCTFVYTCSNFVSSHETNHSTYAEPGINVWPEHRPDQKPLNQFIIHHELLSYSSKPIHERLKRSSNQEQFSSSKSLHIEFHSHGKRFQLRLHPDAHSAYSKSVEFVDADGRQLDVSLDHLYSGHLNEEPSTSHVHGHVVDGLFEGRIHSRDGTFYVERLHRYPHAQGRKKKAHSVIYRAEDVRHPQSDKFEGGCGDDQVRRWMEQVSNSAVPGTESFKYYLKSINSTTVHNPSHSLPHLMYSIEENQPFSLDQNDSIVEHRYKRSPDQYLSPFRNHFLSNPFDEDTNPLRNPAFRISYDNKHRNPANSNGAGLFDSVVSESQQNRRACSLYIQTDTFLWEHIRREVSSDSKAREEISSLVAQHIKAVNHIYENSDFGGIRGLKFIVQRLRVNDSTACDTQRKRDQNQFCSPNIDVSNFLNLNSQFNHDDFCLAYIFTYRDFSGGTLGLAWVASTSGASGGICEKYKSYTENVHGKQVQTKRSLNTGIITFVNYNSRVPPKVSELTLAHEIGHNFGSPHDYPLDCRPGGQTGNYIMYSSATSGERSNNNKFSPCSMRNISSVLAAVFSSEGKHNCFEKHEGPFCGNKIVEENEECDCGYDAKECTDRCCRPRDAGENFRCRRTQGSACSPSEGPCCTETCNFVGPTSVCRSSSECTFESSCNGREAQCPQPAFRPNNTECNGGTQVCLNGQCAGSICLKHKLQECFLTSKNARPDEMCEVACQRGSDTNSCRRISEIVKMRNISGLKLKPGSPCNDFQGYCDVFQRCRAVDAEGPIARLRNLLLNHKTLMSIRQWATTHWWVCMLMGVGLVLFMAAFIKCCAVHTPSSNPKKRPAVRIQDTLRRPADTLRRKRYRSAQQGRRHQHSAHPSGHGPNSIPLQATGAPSNAALHGTGTPYQQTQLVVALPPEEAGIAVSGRVAGDPPPPYPVNASSSSAQTVTPPVSTSSQQPPPLPQRPSQLGVPLQHNNSAHSTSSSGSHHNLLPPPNFPARGHGRGRGHYNRKAQANVPTGSKSQLTTATKPQSGRSKKFNP